MLNLLSNDWSRYRTENAESDSRLFRPNMRDHVSAIDHNVCDEDKADSARYFWPPPSQLIDGDSALARLQKMVESGSPRLTDKDHGVVMVQASGESSERTPYSVCDVTMVDNTAGPPKDCTTVAILKPESTWIRGKWQTPATTCPARARFNEFNFPLVPSRL